MVLSERNCSWAELREAISHLWASFNRLRDRKVWRGVLSEIVTLEITCNEKMETFHPHLNVVFDGPYIAQDWLVENWKEVTEGRGLIVYIRQADSGTLQELFKYVTKPLDLVRSPEALLAFINGTKGLRFIRTYGSMFGLGKEKEETGRLVCPDCGSIRIMRLGRFVAQQLHFDGFGIIRLNKEIEEGLPSPAEDWFTQQEFENNRQRRLWLENPIRLDRTPFERLSKRQSHAEYDLFVAAAEFLQSQTTEDEYRAKGVL